MSETATLHLRGIGVSYGEAVAVDGVDFDVPPGKITALLGPNGAGKSSTMLAAYGAVRSTGKVLLGSEDLSELTQRQRVRNGVVLVPQGRQLFPTMTIEENLRVVADLNGLGQDAVERGLGYFPVLDERRSNPAGVMSGGEQRMLGLARAMMMHPRVLLLDEAVDGLSVGTVRVLMDAIRSLADAGVAVAMAEPTAGPILGAVDRGAVLIRGKVRGTAESADELEATYAEQLGLLDAPLAAGEPVAAATTDPTHKGAQQ